MSPQEIAKSIADELREHPERWTQKAFSRDANGCPGSSTDGAAVCWCAAGHIIKRVPNQDFDVTDNAMNVFQQAIGETLISWNDTRGRTVSEFITLCDKVSQS